MHVWGFVSRQRSVSTLVSSPTTAILCLLVFQDVLLLFQTDAGVWTHVALVYDGVCMKLYVNGKFCNDVTLDGRSNGGLGAVVTIGGRYPTLSNI